jgi:hypothetical protein
MPSHEIADDRLIQINIVYEKCFDAVCFYHGPSFLLAKSSPDDYLKQVLPGNVPKAKMISRLNFLYAKASLNLPKLLANGDHDKMP